MWSSGKMEPYLAVTVHFVDKEWVLQSYCLQTLLVPENHTVENLVPVLQGVLESWGLPVCQVLGVDPKTAHFRLRWQDTEVME